MHVLLFILGVIAVTISLGWRPSLDAARAIATGAWAGLKGLLAGSWSFTKLDTLGLVLTAYGRRVLFLVGVVVLVLSVTVGAATVTGSGDARSNLDAAIRAFQASVSLTADGVFGPATVKAYYGHR